MAERVLAADLTSFFANPANHFAVVQWQSVAWKLIEKDGLTVETGMGSVVVKEVLRSPILKVGANLNVPAERIRDPEIRDRNAFNQWNNLRLETGVYLLMACRPGETPDSWNALAAINVRWPDDANIESARQCIAIEKMDDPKKKAAALESALIAHDSMLPFFALDALGNRQVLGRAAGATLVGKAMASPQLDPNMQIQFGAYLTRSCFFDGSRGADPDNQQAVAILAREILREIRPFQKISLALALASMVRPHFADEPAADQKIRTALIRATGVDANTMSNLLGHLLPHAKKDERVILEDLLQIWKAAF